MARSIDRGRAVMERVYAKARAVTEWRGVQPGEIFVSPIDWDDLDDYLKTTAQYLPPGALVGPTTSIRVRVGDGSGELVEVRNLAWIVVA